MMPRAPDLVRAARAKGVHFQPDGDRLRWWAPPGVVSDRLSALFTAQAGEILRILEQEQRPSRKDADAMTKSDSPPKPTIQEAVQTMLGQMAAGLQANADVGRRRAQEIVQAAEHYAEAYERKVLAEFGARITGSPPPDTKEADDAALALFERVNALPELQPRTPPPTTPRLVPPIAEAHRDTIPSPARESASDSGSNQSAPCEWTRIRIVNTRGRFYVLGENESTKLLQWLSPRIGRKAEWIRVQRGHAGHSLAAAKNTLKQRSVSAVLFIESAMQDWQCQELLDVARKNKIPHAFARDASFESVSNALDDLELALAVA